ncbi:30S ribosomal protein S23 [Nostoc linckia z18]|uniref:30S ribosomal protein S23 n=2 Tax=Nostoc linckia TaxID=92942 RepID=A0A9Q6EIL1_NOSLI|nr:four helix bundle protein [Nostoc linckia]PHK38311.1 30S ribosomal protein S23 [Nostoc linckia z15]PHK43031.1 30S ribosomal protein S23 [Nostoc linckia z16]PHJ57562.1 30S ribosomal protein S23 [Nostoc linckia z1]PHJ59765.1 30S ribosomal protein S23 [Nostoc linckia z3]PHJ64533.1 30S ribosomal protein S23 [Nostoc linckia z2]
MGNIRSFKELRVWKNAINVAMTIFELTKSFPIEERYSLTDQIRRSSRSVAANISESWRKRRYPAAFISKLSDAETEAAETQTWIEIATRCGYLSKEQALDLDRHCKELLSQIVAMISHPEQWTINTHSSKTS